MALNWGHAMHRAIRGFPSSEVEITRRYLIDCRSCGDAVDDGEAFRGTLTRARAEEAKREHIAWHRRELTRELMEASRETGS